jgi:hypothetical protein
MPVFPALQEAETGESQFEVPQIMRGTLHIQSIVMHHLTREEIVPGRPETLETH